MRISIGVIDEIQIRTPYGHTVEEFVAEYGAPEIVGINPRHVYDTAGTPITAAPAAPAAGILFYPSKGFFLEFICDSIDCPAMQTCSGVPRQSKVYYKSFVVPMSVKDWLRKPPHYTECVRPWTGFND